MVACSKLFSFLLLEEFLKRHWKNLRDSMMKCLKKMESFNKSGSGAHKTPRYKNFDAMLFIRDTVTESNIQMEEAIDSNISLSSPNSMSSSANSQFFSLPPSPSPVVVKKSRPDDRKMLEESRERSEKLDLLIAETAKAVKVSTTEDDSDMNFLKSLRAIFIEVASQEEPTQTAASVRI